MAGVYISQEILGLLHLLSCVCTHVCMCVLVNVCVLLNQLNDSFVSGLGQWPCIVEDWSISISDISSLHLQGRTANGFKKCFLISSLHHVITDFKESS
jgi:hypothetical protein